MNEKQKMEMKTDSGDTYSSFSRPFVIVVAFCIVWLCIILQMLRKRDNNNNKQKKNCLNKRKRTGNDSNTFITALCFNYNANSICNK